MFLTPVIPQRPESQITHKDPVITAGSCFADCMGEKFNEYKFSTVTNPFGTVYNPVSLHSQFSMAIGNRIFNPDKITDVQGIFVHYDFHSTFGNTSKNDLINDLHQVLNNVHEFLKTTKYLILTWGTAWVYELIQQQEIVANCHKQPGTIFQKRLLSSEEIIEDFNTFFNELKKFNSEIKIILTVSPVRHIKDTLQLNTISKSTLRIATHKISNSNKDIYYFPSYEIMMDELRDYRYYKEDMIHPTRQAESYIWNKFAETCLDERVRAFIDIWTEIRKAMAHRPFNPDSEAHKKFIKNTISKLSQLKEQVNVDKEIEYLQKQL